LRRSSGICRGIGAGCAALPAFAAASAQVAPLSKHLPESLGKGALTGGSQRGIAYVELTLIPFAVVISVGVQTLKPFAF